MQYFKRLLLSIVVASGAISSANAFTNEALSEGIQQVQWVNPYNSTKAYDFGLDQYSQESESYIGLKVGQMLQDEVPDEYKSRTVRTGIDNLTADVNLDKHDKPLAYGVYGGHTWANGLGLEAQYYEGTNADIDDKTKAVLNGAFEGGAYLDNADIVGGLDMKGYGLAGTYKHRFGDSRFYVKGKVGVNYIETKEDLKIRFNEDTRSNAQEANVAAKSQLNELILAEQAKDFQATPTHIAQKNELSAVLNDTNIILSGVKLDKKYDDTDVLVGLGVGYNFKKNVSVELGYERLGSDADMVTLGIHQRW